MVFIKGIGLLYNHLLDCVLFERLIVMFDNQLDKDLKMAQIKHLEQIVAESQATVEKMREDFRIAEIDRQARQAEAEEERQARAIEREAYIEKMRSEIRKNERDSKYAMWIPIVVSLISSMTAIFVAVAVSSK
ncbi:hypothetical protein [Moraxella equi]|uniref:Uncharacterized protein n=2 Tax=Moraxella equi TaxID=60442 RepID=A0A378UR95_9GAMM|nr:hypothetical protein [Moraxella equi]OPH37675.1 hypothetical protein B5J93_08110 [Moraxella equi]STZ82937.1 Uncharacterised protein [Moraxella equi]